MVLMTTILGSLLSTTGGRNLGILIRLQEGDVFMVTCGYGGPYLYLTDVPLALSDHVLSASQL